MKSYELGFHHGAPENPDRTWEKQINGRTHIFTKTREREGLFLYGCQGQSGGLRRFHSGWDLSPDEVERLPQFKDFLGA